MPSDELATKYRFDDFTESAYRKMLLAAKRRYSFEPFGTAAERSHALWRHDVDFSMHRALRLAEIEADEGVRATYFLSLHSELYNLLEAPVFDRARRILKLGHWVGLHFDAAFYGDEPPDALEDRAAFERRTLEELLRRPVEAVSFHNPDTRNLEAIFEDQVAGMTNAYGASIQERYFYVSDSNGYWRHRRLPDVLSEGSEERLHVLTHPEWWQSEPMSPRERLERCIEGRSAATRSWYEGLLEERGRENVG